MLERLVREGSVGQRHPDGPHADAGDGPVDPAQFVLPPPDPARAPNHRAATRSGRPTWITPAIACAVLIPVLVALVIIGRNRSDTAASSTDTTAAENADDSSTDASAAEAVDASDTSLAPLEPYDGWVNPASVGGPTATRSTACSFPNRPAPTTARARCRPPAGAVDVPGESSGGCARSRRTSRACAPGGSGWTGQPNVWEKDGKTWVAFGAYDRGVHFLDAETGAVAPDFKVGDIIKGTVTVDPTASISTRRPRQLTGPGPRRAGADRALEAVGLRHKPVMWNDDWDGSASSSTTTSSRGENGWIYAVKLNRAYDANGKVTVDPKVVWKAPGWDAEQLKSITDKKVSIENSVAISGNTLYFANSGGLVQGWDISGLKEGTMPTRTFRFWTGDDTDASIVIDADGMLYVGSEYERNNARSKEVGQIMKLDPTKPDNPLVWSIKDQGASKAGIWGTTALWKDVVYTDTNGGRLLGIDRATGAIRWEKKLPGPTWQSPVV
jgi:hypothetical protein